MTNSDLDLHKSRSLQSYAGFSVFLLCYAILIILWGAWVRISGSGDGCGPHWPLCKGQLWINDSFTEQLKTWIEFAHRLKSGLFGILIVIQFFWARRIFPENHSARKAAAGALFFTITEALLGAKLVLFGLVGNDDSVFRAASMSLHLGNTLFLLYFLTACFESASLTSARNKLIPPPRLLIAHCSLLMIAVCGAWAALASTLFPSESLISGIQDDFSSDSHWLLRIRIIHPLLAIILTAAIFFIIQKLKEASENTDIKKASKQVQVMIAVTVIIGFTTLLTGAPVALKILHLLCADLAWIALTRLSLRSVSVKDASHKII